MQRTVKLALILLLLAFTQQLGAAGFSVEAQVDRNEIGFGESFNLVVTLSQNLTSGRTNRLNMPAIDSIPGFDIASTRTGQSTTFINGVGQTRSQIVYELVPQKPGKAVIPAFSFQDGNGDPVSTRPIEINVMAPEDEPEEEKAAVPQTEKKPSNNDSLFRGLLFVGLILGCIVALPFMLSAFFNRNVKPTTRWNEANATSESGLAQNASAEKRDNNVEDAQIIESGAIVKNRPARINFPEAVAALKREFPEADNVFYARYFAVFKDALLGNNGAVSADMTMDELFMKVCNMNGREDMAVACKRIAGDMEMVMYANRSPIRGFSSIDADAREIINAISE